MRFDINVGEGPVADFFDRINKFTDKMGPRIVEDYDHARNWSKRYSTPLKIGAGVLGAGITYNKLRDAQKSNIERRKLKSEKKYYDTLLNKMDNNNNNEKIAGMKDILKKIDPRKIDPKTKQILGGVLRNSAIMAGGTIAATEGVNLFNKMKKRLNNKEEKYWNNFVQKYPEYTNKPDAKQYFSLLVETSPTLAKHPIAVRSYMKGTLDATEEGALNFGRLGDISKLQQGYNKRDNGNIDTKKLTQNINSTVNNAFKQFDESVNKFEQATSPSKVAQEAMQEAMMNAKYNKTMYDYSKWEKEHDDIDKVLGRI